jgi:hypothetical protein
MAVVSSAALDVTLEASNLESAWKYDATCISMDMRFKEALLCSFMDEHPKIDHVCCGLK